MTSMPAPVDSDIVFVASCNVDLVSYAKRMPQIGETLMGDSFKTGFGGKGANKAVACSRLGSKCAVIAKLGDDVFGRDYLKNFADNGISVEHVSVTDKAATGVAPICVDENGDNSILVILGANLLLSPNDIDASLDLIQKCRVLVTNLEIPSETALHSLKLAKHHNILTVLNFAPAPTEFNPELLSNSDYLILNEVEMAQITSKPCATVDETIIACGQLLDNYRVGSGVIVTLGKQGVVYVDSNTRLPLHKECMPAAKPVVDTSGAGDAFVGAFCHYLNELGSDRIGEILRFACNYATKTVQEKGTQSSYPLGSDLETSPVNDKH